jgi:hypothetical protein
VRVCAELGNRVSGKETDDDEARCTATQRPHAHGETRTKENGTVGVVIRSKDPQHDVRREAYVRGSKPYGIFLPEISSERRFKPPLSAGKNRCSTKLHLCQYGQVADQLETFDQQLETE